VIDLGPEQGKWKPDNYSKKFYGPSPMRLGVERSRNLMTVRLAKTIGMTPIVEVARRFGVNGDMPKHLSMALGAGETTLLRLTTAYAMLVNGGKAVTPALIDRVQDKVGKTIFRNDTRECAACLVKTWDGQAAPEIADDRQQIAEPTSVYQVVSMLQGVVQRGTGRRVASLGKPLAGKTGTTNDSRDAWFIGFAPDLAVGVFVGFDQPRTLGDRETGSNVAAPIFKSFMANALEGQPTVPFRIPAGIRHVRVNAKTGRLARPGDRNVILEAFKVGTEPENDTDYRVLDESSEGASPSAEGGRPQSVESPSTPSRGLY
jgi:penicillin-binding protein 1A